MLALGIILVVLAVAALVAALAGGSSQPASFDLGLVKVQTNTLGVFLLGAGTVLLLVIGLALIRVGIRRAQRRRQDRKKLNRLTQQLETRDSTSTQAGGTEETEAQATTTPPEEPLTEQDRRTP